MRHTIHTFENLTNLVGQRYPSKVVFIILGINTTKDELRAGGCKFESKHRRSYFTLGDKSLE